MAAAGNFVGRIDPGWIRYGKKIDRRLPAIAVANTPMAVTAGLTYLLAHACYKGALFLVAGAVEHETGTRDVSALAGLRRAMPATAIAAGLAAASMAGVPLFAGFIAKEQFYESLGWRLDADFSKAATSW